MSAPAVTISSHDGLGVIRLDKPGRLNALDEPMIAAAYGALLDWADSGSVTAVLIDGVGERGLCAGGDVRSVWESARGDGELARRLWRTEYRMNSLIATFPDPVTSLMHGLVLGGGVGIAAHAGTRVVSENSRVGMPEVIIGMVPDVGGLWLLSRSPGELGTHLALTGLQVGPADAILCGLADVHVPVAALDGLRAGSLPERLELAVAGAVSPAAAGVLAGQQNWIDECYAADSVSEIVGRLAGHADPEARATAELILTRSPTAVTVTLAAIRRARGMSSLQQVLDMDYRVMAHSLERPDLIEGIRAQIIDKDRNPRWQPARLADVTPASVAAHFADRGDDELGLATG